MIATKFGPLESLVGRTFERDGEYRFVSGIYPFGVAVMGQVGAMVGNSVVGTDVAWEPEAFLRWCSGAVEVKDGRS